MSEPLQTWLPGRAAAANGLLKAILVGATLVVLGSDLLTAAATAGLFLLFIGAVDGVAVVVGDYADHVALGLLTLALTGYLAVVGFHLALVVGIPVGGWLVFDGVQHLRHGETRNSVSVQYSHDGGPVFGLLRALGARLLAPFRLYRAS